MNKNKIRGHFYRWVIQSRDKRQHWYGEQKYYAYSLDRVSYKTPGHLRTGRLVDARKFKTKREAEIYFYKRVNYGGQMSGLVIRRRKFFHDGKYMLYFENINR